MQRTAAIICCVLILMATAPSEGGVIREDKGDSDWEFLLSPYLWGVSLKGTSRVGILPEVDVDASFSDILDNLQFGGSLHMELHRGRWAFILDPTYLDLEAEGGAEDALLQPTIAIKAWIVEGLVGYKLTANWELLGGFRWQQQELKVDPGLPEPPFPPTSFGTKQDWTDWLIGTRFSYPIGSSRWVFFGRGDVSVFGDSDTNYNLQISFDRRIRKTMMLNVGYRFMETDYDDFPNYVWDVRQQGPYLGYTWSF